MRVFCGLDAGLLDECARLRHTYFVRQRQWAHESSSDLGRELDVYDAHALHLGVWDEMGLSAYLRVLPFDSPLGFMLDREFSCLVDESLRDSLRRSGTVELSRLVVRSDVALSSRPHPVERLLKGLYHLAREQEFDRFAIVVEEAWLRPFKRRFGLPFRASAPAHTFPDGTRTVAAVATLEELEFAMQSYSPEKYAWYQSQSEDGSQNRSAT